MIYVIVIFKKRVVDLIYLKFFTFSFRLGDLIFYSYMYKKTQKISHIRLVVLDLKIFMLINIIMKFIVVLVWKNY